MSEMKALLDEDAPGETADPTREDMELPVVSICGRCGAEQRGEWKLEWRTNHGCTPHPDAFALAIAKARGDVPAVDPVENTQYEADAERRADLDEHQLDMDSRWLANDHDVRSHR